VSVMVLKVLRDLFSPHTTIGKVANLRGQQDQHAVESNVANNSIEKPAFTVERDPLNDRDILFKLRGNIPVPPNQARLMNEVGATLTVISLLFPEKDNKFESYFAPLLSLAKAGVGDEPAYPDLALGSLQSLKNDILAREGGRIKNQHMRQLGLWSLTIGLPTLIAAILLRYYNSLPLISQFLFLVTGSIAGVWVSFGARKTILKFEDLHIPEEDRLDPVIRIFFASILTITLGLLFSVNAVVLTVGSVTTSEINTSVRIALLLGLACGFSEQVLSQKVTHQIGAFLDFKK
jgi:hypothetical protein